mmetsp:Transcript_59046/g.93408  ORF Transcript_59046/g.93408 Transcript_59046/m.93408 type:complete len:230 (-) Transcript_59046:1346-2035(-)
MLAETPDHWMHNLHAIRWQVDIETCILLHNDLPFGSQRVAQRKQAVPVQVRVRPNSQLCRHVFDHLWGNLALLHVVWNATGPQEDPHGAQALQLELLDLCIQHIRPGVAFLLAVDFFWRGARLLFFPKAIVQHLVLPEGFATSGVFQSGFLHFLIFLLQGVFVDVDVLLDKGRDLSQGESLESGFREAAQAKSVEKVHILHLRDTVHGFASAPAMKWINRLARIGRHYL